MRIFIAGATGTLGRPVTRILLSHGHYVVGLSRTETGRRAIEAAGAAAVVGDALDAARLRTLVIEARPDVVVHLLTALPAAGPMRPSQLRATNALRTAGTTNLLEAAIQAGARRLVAESFVGVYGTAPFTTPASEDAPLPPPTRGAFREATEDLRTMEELLRGAREARRIETVALRIGFLYGSEVPSTSAMLKQARAGLLFAPRDLGGIGAFVHNDDAASAIVAAIEAESPSSLYNIVDDEPADADTYLTLLADSVHARPPRRLPAWVVKLAAPLLAELGAMSLRLSNAKARRELGWAPRYPTIRDGMAEVARTMARAA